jgi:ATP-dependent RNA helicase DeaD
MSKFEEMGFTPGILKAIEALGFEEPMPVQEKVIPLMLGDESDIIALAQTGTGKTAAFGLPLVQTTDTELNKTQALILSPTRELCMQITADLMDYSKFTGKLKILAVYGGSSIDTQIRSLRRGVHIIVATPGRLIDLVNRGVADLSSVTTLVLDEADEMLNMGFLDSIQEILEELP